MSLAPGSRVGIYEVVEMIGVGGMGEVYRATDSRLDRPVAIKTLPEEFAADRDRLARFEREAKVLAQLNHPHIASIYGIEPGPPAALAMEMAEGETLAHRIAAGPLPLDDAIVIARQIAEALEHAHAKGIVHRDLKPANIKIGAPGGDPHVKVLDFGLAKAMSPDVGGSSSPSALSSPTITSPANLTRAGVVLGTAAYMAPEQARGRHVDHRADVWAFGCVLFEMLAGRRPFEGEEIADVIARVIQSEPDWSLLPDATPHGLRTVLRRCLRKDPHQRVHSIADVRIELEEIQSGAASPLPSQVGKRPAWLAALGGVAIGAAVTAAAFLWVNSHDTPPSSPPPVVRFSVEPPPGWRLGRTPGTGRLVIALSPDGQKIATLMMTKDGTRRVFVRRFQDTDFRELPGTDGATSVFWAPDSTRLGFLAAQAVHQIDVNGGNARQIAPLTSGSSGSWSTQDMLAVATTNAGLVHVWPASSGVPAPIGNVPVGLVARVMPRWLPDGSGFLVVDNFGTGEWMLRFQKLSGETVDIKPFQSSGAGAPATTMDYQAGYLLLSTGEPSGRTVLTAQKLDAKTWQFSGDAAVLVNDLNVAFTASGNGTLAFARTRPSFEQFVWLDESGRATSTVARMFQRVANFDLSHDERFLAIQTGTELSLHDLTRGVTSPLIQSATDPIWSADDRSIAYTVAASQKGGIYVMPAFGGPSRQVYNSAVPIYVEDWSRDGQWLAATERGGALRLIPLSGREKSITVPRDEDGIFDEPQFSPDGKWLATGLNLSAGNEVLLMPMPPTGERWQLSVGGGVQPRWADDGKAVYFLTANGALMRVDVTLAPGARPTISAPRQVLQTAISPVQQTLDQYALSKDRRRVLIRRAVEEDSPANDLIHVIVNWPSLLNAARNGT